MEQAASQIQDSRDLVVVDAMEVSRTNRLGITRHTRRISDLGHFTNSLFISPADDINSCDGGLLIVGTGGIIRNCFDGSVL